MGYQYWQEKVKSMSKNRNDMSYVLEQDESIYAY